VIKMPYRSKKITKPSPKKSLRLNKRNTKPSPKKSLRLNKRNTKPSPKKSVRYTVHTIGTYNMSFASDLGLDPTRQDVYESEAAFLLSNNSGDPRKFWKNALENVIYFWKAKTFIKHHNPSFLGLQEINKTEVGSLTGSAIIRQKLKEINPYIDMITEEIDSGKSKPALCCIWDTKKLGLAVKTEISNHRSPILTVYTTKGYLLVVLHNRHLEHHNDDLEHHNLLDFRKNLNYKINNFSEDLKLYKDRIFICGDFNDKYDALQTLYLTNNITLKYKGAAPKSCCHNWNSSCSDSRYTPITNIGGKDIGTCAVPIDSLTQKPYPLSGPGKRTPMGPEGDIPNYRYYGDKVFGQNPVSNIDTMRKVNNVRSDLTNTSHSKESDHEMVICTFRTKL